MSRLSDVRNVAENIAFWRQARFIPPLGGYATEADLNAAHQYLKEHRLDDKKINEWCQENIDPSCKSFSHNDLLE